MNNKAPLQALREAQLTIYRHPERIADLAGERGAPSFTKTVQLPPTKEKPGGDRAATKL